MSTQNVTLDCAIIILNWKHGIKNKLIANKKIKNHNNCKRSHKQTNQKVLWTYKYFSRLFFAPTVLCSRKNLLTSPMFLLCIFSTTWCVYFRLCYYLLYCKWRKNTMFSYTLIISVSDPSHFDVDPDPGIHILEKWIRILGSTFP